MIIWLVCSCLVTTSMNALAATATKEISDSLHLQKGSVINIHSTKANITVFGWNRPVVVIKIRLTFENPIQAKAQTELEYAHVNVLKAANGISANNYFSLPSAIDKLTSEVKVEYTIYAPNEVNILVNNEYGDCMLNHLTAFINVNNKYGKVGLNDVNGLIRIYGILCHITANNIGGEVTFNTSNSDYRLDGLAGKITIENNVGNMTIRPAHDLNFLKINSTHSEIELLISDFIRFNYNLSARNARVLVRDEYLKYSFQKKSAGLVISAQSPKNPWIEASTSYNNIKLN
jgi:hypothetical protein